LALLHKSNDHRHFAGDALIELDLRAGPGGLIPLRIVLRLLPRCRLPQRWPARRGDLWWLGGFADVVEDLFTALASLMKAMIRTCELQIGQLSGMASSHGEFLPS
jgi:hypothetical protein